MPEETAIVLSVAEYEELKGRADERDDYLKRLQRAVADYQNLQKRMAKLGEEARRNALREIVLKVVPLADTLAHALNAIEGHEAAGSVREGLQLIEKEFYTILGALGVEPIEALGQPFDPHYHEAVLQEPGEDVEPNTVVRQFKKGFIAGEMVIRPAQVSVATPPKRDEQQAQGN